MNKEVELILAKLKIVSEEEERGLYLCDKEHSKILLDYITNLQEELDRCVKANVILDDENAELQGENQKLKELCNKYEEEHSTTFNEWKETITDKYQTLKNLQEENERLKEELEKADSITQSCIFEGSRSAGKSYRQCLNWLEDYKSRNEKAKSLTNRTVEIIKQQPSGNDEWILERLNGINYCLGGDEEC